MTSAGALTEYRWPTPSPTCPVITVALDGNIWFTETFANRIGRVETDKKQPPLRQSSVLERFAHTAARPA